MKWRREFLWGPLFFALGNPVAFAGPDDWPKRDLTDWGIGEAKPALSQAQDCAVDVTAHLAGTRRQNYLALSMSNRGVEPREFHADQVSLRFGDGEEFFPAYERKPGVISLVEGERVETYLPFADKALFRGQNRLVVRIPLRDGAAACVTTVTLERQKSDDNPESSLIFDGYDTSFELGGSFAKFGNLGEAVGKGFQFNLVTHGFFNLHHGLVVGFEFQNLGTPNTGLLQGATGGLTDPHLSGSCYFLGYGYRGFLSDRFTVGLDIAPGLYSFFYTLSPGAQTKSDFALSVTGRVAVDFLWARVLGHRPFDSDHRVGLVLEDGALVGGGIGPVSVSGHNLAAFLRYQVGL